MVRNGHETRIPVEDVVIGDVVLVNGGDKVPADIRILHANSFKVEYFPPSSFIFFNSFFNLIYFRLITLR